MTNTNAPISHEKGSTLTLKVNGTTNTLFDSSSSNNDEDADAVIFSLKATSPSRFRYAQHWRQEEQRYQGSRHFHQVEPYKITADAFNVNDEPISLDTTMTIDADEDAEGG